MPDYPDLVSSLPDPEFSVLRSGDGRMINSSYMLERPMVDDSDETPYNNNACEIVETDIDTFPY